MGFGDFFSDMAPMIGTGLGSAIGGPVGGAIGGGIGGAVQAEAARRRQAEANEANYLKQKEFAQNGIRWKVADSIAAGIHPLVGLGASTQSFAANIMPEPTPDMSGMSQDLSRAISSTRTQDERDLSQLTLQSARLDLQGKDLDNQIKATQLRKLNSTGPAFPGSETFIPGQGNSSGPGRISTKAMERTASLPGAPHMEPGAINDVGFAATSTGLVPIPSKDVKERIEDNMPHEWSHFWRNNVSPDYKNAPPASALPPGASKWKWNTLKMEWQPYRPEGKPARTDKAWEIKKMYREGA